MLELFRRFRVSDPKRSGHRIFLSNRRRRRCCRRRRRQLPTRQKPGTSAEFLAESSILAGRANCQICGRLNREWPRRIWRAPTGEKFLRRCAKSICRCDNRSPRDGPRATKFRIVLVNGSSIKVAGLGEFFG